MTYRQDLWDVASVNHGVVTTAEAEEAGVPAVEMRKLAQRGVLKRLARGVYLHTQVPRDRFTDAAEAVATVGPDGFLEWDAVLSLYDLALVDPPFVQVGVTRRYRGTPRAHVRVSSRHHPMDAQNLTYHEGIRGVTVERALLDALERIPPDRVRQAAAEAEARGLMSPDQVAELRSALRSFQRRQQTEVKATTRPKTGAMAGARARATKKETA